VTEAARRPDPPEGLWWMYLLLGAALAAVGAAAGQLLFGIDGLRRFTAVRNCLLDYGIVIDQPWPVNQHTTKALAACTTSYQVTEGTVMAVGAVLVPLLAWLLMLGGGLTMRVRLLRHGAVSYRSAALSVVQERFEYWCDGAGLTGRRRPTLLLGRPGRLTRQAYCIAVPLSRPIVVIPAGYAYRDTDELDLVVLHELAHVRAGDIAWASAAWWTGWLNLPVLLIALSPLLRHPGTLAGSIASTLAVAVALSLATLMLRAALLRHREQAADRYALAVTGRPEVLRTALGTRPVHTGRVGSRLSGRTAEHPPPDARLSAATMPAGAADAWRGGFAMAAAASVVALFGYQLLYTVLTDLLRFPRLDNRLPSDAALAIAALLWAGVLVPAWARYSATGAWRGWWPAVTGSTAGLLAGFFLWSPGSLFPRGLTIFADDLPVAVGWTAVVAVGATLFAVGLAAPLHVGTQAAGWHAAARRGAVLGAAAVLTTGLTVCSDWVEEDRLGASVSVQRANLVSSSGVSWWRWMPLVIMLTVGTVALTCRPARPRPALLFSRRDWIVVLAVGATAAAVGITLSQLHTGSLQTADGRFLLVAQRWWVCALAGWVTTAALLFAHRPTSPPTGAHTAGRGYPFTLPTALLAGTAATALAGAAQYARDVLADPAGRLAHDLLSDLRHPVWLELELILLSLPVLVAWWQLTTRRGYVDRPRSWRLVAGTVAACAVLGAAVATGSAYPVTIAPGDYSSLLTFAQSPAPRFTVATVVPHPSGSTPAGAADPGRPIDPTTAGTALAAVRRLLPASWAPTANSSTPNTGYQPNSCRDLFARDEAAEHARPKAADETRTYSVRPDELPPEGAYLVVSLTSYRSTRDAAQAFATPSAETAACPQWSADDARTDDKRVHLSITAPPPPTLAYATYQAIADLTYRVNSTSFMSTWVLLWTLVGHNLLEAQAEYLYFGQATISADRLALLQNLTAAASSQIITSLQ